MAKVAVVTGGSGSIGLACGRALAGRGYRVVLTARRPEPLRLAAEEIGAEWVVADAASEESFAAVTGPLDEVHVLVHASGILEGTYVRRQEQATFEHVIAVNLSSCHVVTHAVLPKMPAGGRIVFISSSAAHEPMLGLTGYSAAKAGMNGFAGALAREVDRDGISVHLVTPAPVDTPMITRATFPMLTITADDVASAVLWLDTLHPSVQVPEIRMHAVERGPFAPAPTQPAPRD